MRHFILASFVFIFSSHHVQAMEWEGFRRSDNVTDIREKLPEVNPKVQKLFTALDVHHRKITRALELENRSGKSACGSTFNLIEILSQTASVALTSTIRPLLNAVDVPAECNKPENCEIYHRCLQVEDEFADRFFDVVDFSREVKKIHSAYEAIEMASREPSMAHPCVPVLRQYAATINEIYSIETQLMDEFNKTEKSQKRFWVPSGMEKKCGPRKESKPLPPIAIPQVTQ